MKSIFKKEYQHSISGFSIIEMLIYIAILSSMAVVVVNVVIVLAQSYGSIQASRNINTSAVIALERIVRDIRFSESVDVVNSTLGSHPGRLTLVLATTSSPTVEFYLDSGVLKVRENGVNTGSITSDKTAVTNLVFRQVTNGERFLVKIEMTLESVVGKTTKTENFYDSAVLRGSY